MKSKRKIGERKREQIRPIDAIGYESPERKERRRIFNHHQKIKAERKYQKVLSDLRKEDSTTRSLDDWKKKH